MTPLTNGRRVSMTPLTNGEQVNDTADLAILILWEEKKLRGVITPMTTCERCHWHRPSILTPLTLCFRDCCIL
jgi:hypothetical protein